MKTKNERKKTVVVGQSLEACFDAHTKKAGLLQGLSGKESTVNAGDVGLIPRWARSPGEGMTIHSNMLAWEIWCTEEPDGLLSVGVTKKSDVTEQHAKKERRGKADLPSI